MNVTAWNRAHPAGTQVMLMLDDGRARLTRTRSLAWELADGTPMVLLDGLTGGWLLSRVTVASDPDKAP